MARLPRHQKQLGRGVPVPGRTRGSRDCGPRTLQVGIDFLTEGQKVPGPFEIRKRMGREGPQPTNVYDARRAVESYKNIRGRQPLRYWVKGRILDVEMAVRSGKFVQGCIDYAEWNRLMPKTGDPNFRDGHSIGILGQKKRSNGTIVWLVYDSLDDARRAGIPQGPRWLPKWKVIKAMEKFGGGKGRCYAGVFGGGQKK